MKRPFLALALAIGLALIAGVFVFWFAAGADDRALASQNPTTVLVSQSSIPKGMSLSDAQTQGLLASTQVPAELKPDSSLSDVTLANGSSVAIEDIPPGQLLLTSAFGQEAPQEQAIDIPDGLMAVTVALEDPAKVGAFLRPGVRVAVFDTRVEDPQQGVSTTRPLLDDVLVLAIGDVPEQAESQAATDVWSAPLVTLAVDQRQAERLVHATRTGQLYLALLGPEATINNSTGVSDATLY